MEMERKFLIKGCTPTTLLAYFSARPKMFRVYDDSSGPDNITQWYSPNKIGKCDMRIRKVVTYCKALVADPTPPSNQPWEDHKIEGYKIDNNYRSVRSVITFKSPVPGYDSSTRNEFETELALTEEATHKLVDELQIGHTRVDKVRYMIEWFDVGDNEFVLEIDVYPGGTIVMEIENIPLDYVLPSQLTDIIDHELTGDIKYLNCNYEFVQKL